ncbi:hypothetical protein CAPTEDRAFT_201519 [Capitella teleta]|uniref:Uncharacterized protein n=1 Tax=Capitella teleta TaxID=283909 RepID=R7UNE0_CAPTE|nr:hypothetical protein CAPTEDRAFT_201519 [Capitella teleta]|eukprot:ELU07583.1 hypothetical protein CAPTEDRAFT_201519 [Capitella teleta]
MPNRCEPRGGSLCCWIISLHILIFMSLGLSLVVRYKVNGTREFINLPSDQRVIPHPRSSFFCQNRVISSKIVKDNGLSNSDPHFDLYLLDKHPSHWNKTSKDSSLEGTYGLKEGALKTYTLGLLNGSMTSFSLCDADAEYKDDGIDKSVEYCISTGSTPPKNHVSKYCDIQGGQIALGPCSRNQTSTSFNASISGDHTISIWNRMKNSPAAFQIHLNIRRQVYDIPNEYIIAKDSKEEHVNNSFLVVEFNHWEEVVEHFLDQIHLEYSCNPHVSVYIGVFFGLPFALVIITSITCLAVSNRNGYQAM